MANGNQQKAALPPERKVITPEENAKAMRVMLENNQKQRQQIALALGTRPPMDVDKFIRIAVSEIMGDYKLQEADPISVVGAVVQAAQTGLSVDRRMGQAYLVTFFNKNLYGKDKGGNECQLMVGYKGLVLLAMRSGKVTRVEANAVHEGDYFEFEKGTDPYLHHRPIANPKKRGEFLAAYSVAFMKAGGPPPFEIMWEDEIETIRHMSRSGNDNKGNPIGIWRDHYSEMAKKTVFRRQSKWLPLTPEFQLAGSIDELNEMGKTKASLEGDFESGFVNVSTVTDETQETNGAKQPPTPGMFRSEEVRNAVDRSKQPPPKDEPKEVRNPPVDVQDLQLKLRNQRRYSILREEFLLLDPEAYEKLPVMDNMTRKQEEELIANAERALDELRVQKGKEKLAEQAEVGDKQGSLI